MTKDEFERALRALLLDFKEGSRGWCIIRGTLLGLEWKQESEQVNIERAKNLASLYEQR